MSATTTDVKKEDLDKYDKPKGLYERLLGDKPWPVRSRGERAAGAGETHRVAALE